MYLYVCIGIVNRLDQYKLLLVSLLYICQTNSRL
uniref:Uncharacterized protein n=1 Tax=Setaria viridis TaxID=4556 RepID=A0A4U6W1Y0_SETVI|nr:hypothetical protein SEVIR_2G310460v2 [Setaria viridis]